MFACAHCAWRGSSLTALLEHACGEAALSMAPEPESPGVTLARKLAGELVDRGLLDSPAPQVEPAIVPEAPAPTAAPTRKPGRPRKPKRVEFKFDERSLATPAEVEAARKSGAPFLSLDELHQAGLHDRPGKPSAAKRSRHQTMFTGSLAPTAPKRIYPKKPLWPEGNSLPADQQPQRNPQLQNTTITPSVKGDPDSDDFEPERLADHGVTPVADEPTPNPSHPVRSHIKAAAWRQTTPSGEAERRYCVCGILLPMKIPERCPECGRKVSEHG